MKNGIYTKKVKTVILKVKEPPADNKCGGSGAACEIARGIYVGLSDNQEHFCALFLDRQNNITGYKVVTSGAMASSSIDMKVLFSNALQFGAQGIICVHNHPSNTKTPSGEDIVITEKIYKAGQLLDIEVLDHIILTYNDYYSMRDKGIFKKFSENKQL